MGSRGDRRVGRDTSTLTRFASLMLGGGPLQHLLRHVELSDQRSQINGACAGIVAELAFELMHHSLRLLLNCLCDELVLGDGSAARDAAPREPQRAALVGNEISLMREVVACAVTPHLGRCIPTRLRSRCSLRGSSVDDGHHVQAKLLRLVESVAAVDDHLRLRLVVGEATVLPQSNQARAARRAADERGHYEDVAGRHVDLDLEADEVRDEEGHVRVREHREEPLRFLLVHRIKPRKVDTASARCGCYRCCLVSLLHHFTVVTLRGDTVVDVHGARGRGHAVARGRV